MVIYFFICNDIYCSRNNSNICSSNKNKLLDLGYFNYCFFYYLIFKIKLYKHHYFSMVLIVLIGIFIDLFLGNLQKDITNNFLLLLLRFLREILHSSDYVILKYPMEKNIVQNMIYVYTLD